SIVDKINDETLTNNLFMSMPETRYNALKITVATLLSYYDREYAELEGMDELAREDEMLNMSVKNNTIIIQYIQDIYRFFKLYHNKGDFEDIFLTKLDFYNKNFINAICREPKFILKIADFYFKTENYTEALEVFQLYLKTEKPDMDILQKAGYCMQRNKKYQEALEYYLKAELFGSGVPWLIKKIAYCYQCLRNYNKALEYYNEASRLEEDNPQVIMNIANCYLNLEDYKKALNYYYKIEFSFKENTGIYRPIAWCLFVLGDLKKSEEYFLKLIEYSLANPYDYMNYGHVLWAKGQREEASVYYLKSLDSMGNNFSRFTNSLNADSQHLIRYNIPKEEIQLMLDYLSFMLENN
ncbi:MAG: tetratricopeptide repeat protein, partial [Bacteroidales bacterium]|nr:tetratricopeptide repeat protein [Bacteroidales bacterium]